MAYGGAEYPVMTHMVMGSRPIAVTDCYAEDGFLYVKGTNFTAYSVVTLDGKREKKTEFLDASTLRIPMEDAVGKLTDLNFITVRQISNMNDLLSETKPYHPNRDGSDSNPESFTPELVLTK